MASSGGRVRRRSRYTENVSELQNVVDRLHNSLGRPILLEDTHGRTVAYSSGHEAADSVRTASILQRKIPEAVERYVRALGVFESVDPMRVRLPEDLAPDHLARIAFPVRYAERSFGVLWIIDDDDELIDAEVTRCVDTALQAGVLLYEAELAQRLDSGLLAHVLSPVEQLRRQASAQLAQRGFSGRLIVAVFRPTDHRADSDHRLFTDLVEAQVITNNKTRLTLVIEDHLVVLLTDPSAQSEQEQSDETGGLVQDLLTRLGSGAPRHRWAAGVGDPVHSLEEARQSYNQALLAVDLAIATQADPPMTRWRTMGAFRALIHIRHFELSEVIDPRLAVLLNEEHSGLLKTLEELLDRAWDVNGASDALRVHRATLHYRLKRVEALTGLNMSSGLDRLTVHLGIKLARISSGTVGALGDSWGPRALPPR